MTFGQKKMNEILQIIPQRPPFVFVDKVVYVDEQSAEINYTITEDCPLVDNKQLPLAGVLEHAAQSCAARIGYLQSTQNEPIRIGYIGAVKKLELKRVPAVGERLVTKVTLLESVLDISLLQCDTFVEGELIAQTTLKLALV
jgi:predicted hotdog family 3-hydroxylacyl-ACP dehydratase